MNAVDRLDAAKVALDAARAEYDAALDGVLALVQRRVVSPGLTAGARSGRQGRGGSRGGPAGLAGGGRRGGVSGSGKDSADEMVEGERFVGETRAPL